MPTETDIESRIDRAQTEEMEAVLVATEPQVIVEVENHDATGDDESIYTVVPEQGYCGCHDSRYRNVICKHQLFLAGMDNDVGSFVRQEMGNEMQDLQSRLATLQDQVRSVEDRAEQLRRARALGAPDGSDGLETDDGGDGEAKSEQQRTSERRTFREMVDDLTA